MKTSKRNHWLYVNSVVLLLALLLFSLVPLFNGIWQINQNTSNNSPNPDSELLQSQASGYEMVLQREPDNQTALEGLLDIKFKQGDLIGVIPPLKRLAQINPTYMTLLAQTQQQAGDLGGASTTYRNILDKEPGNINALKGLSDLLVLQGRSPEAIDLVQNTLKINNPNINTTSVQLVLAEIYLQQKQKPQALKIYEQAIEANTEDFRPILAKALLLKSDGEKQKAKELLEKALNLAPEVYKSSIMDMVENTSNAKLSQ